MPIAVLLRLLKRYGAIALLLPVLAGAGCQPAHDAAETVALPPVGHFEGSLALAGQPEVRVALDIRHPSPGHYNAELTAPAAPALSFVADTIFFSNNQLRLMRPARPGQTLALTLDGDFWRGTFALDSLSIPAILVRRGAPSPLTYRVEELPRATGSAWLFAPADISTEGPALVLLPDAAMAGATAVWADALAREGTIVLALPAADSASAADEAVRLHAAIRLLRNTAGADTANIGIWVSGRRTEAAIQALTAPDGPRTAFIIAQNATLNPGGKTIFRELRRRQLPVLGLYSGPRATPQATAFRNALGGARRSSTVHVYRSAGADLLVPAALSPQLAPGLPGDVMQWLREK